MITLTPELIQQLRTPQGGFNMETMEIIGQWPLVEGWQERLVGMKVSDRNWKAMIKAKMHKRRVLGGNKRRR